MTWIEQNGALICLENDIEIRMRQRITAADPLPSNQELKIKKGGKEINSVSTASLAQSNSIAAQIKASLGLIKSDEEFTFEAQDGTAELPPAHVLEVLYQTQRVVELVSGTAAECDDIKSRLSDHLMSTTKRSSPAHIDLDDSLIIISTSTHVGIRQQTMGDQYQVTVHRADEVYPKPIFNDSRSKCRDFIKKVAKNITSAPLSWFDFGGFLLELDTLTLVSHRDRGLMLSPLKDKTLEILLAPRTSDDYDEYFASLKKKLKVFDVSTPPAQPAPAEQLESASETATA